MIPQTFIDELLIRCDLVELIDAYIPLKKRGNNYLACCPFHNEKTPSFNVIAKKQFYHCFGCGASGNAISFIMQYLHHPFIEAVEVLAARLGMTVPTEKKSADKEKTQGLYQTLEQVKQFYQDNLKQEKVAVDYLKQRGLNGLIAKKYELGYAPSGWHELEKKFPTLKKELIASGMLIQKDNGSTYDRYRHRIMFPIQDRRGRLVGFGGRAIESDQQPKYLNSPETVIFQKNRELYGLYQALQANQKPEFMLVVEGYLDVIAVAQQGITNVVAALGTAVTPSHIQALSQSTRHIIFCLDGDVAGQEAAWRALELSLPYLNEDLAVSFVFLPEGQDPDSFIRTEGRDKFLNYVLQASPLSEFLINRLSAGIKLQQLAGKNQFILAIKPYLQRIPQGAFRQLLLNELSRLTHIENHRIETIIGLTRPEKSLPNKSMEAAADAFTKNRISRSPARLVIAILLQNPELFSECAELIEAVDLDGEEQFILSQISAKLSQMPSMTTALLIETWREEPLFEQLNQLAYWDHQIPDEQLSRELRDLLYFFKKQGLEKKINQYIEKSRKHGLTDAEQLFLQNLLKERHQTSTIN